MVKQKQWFLAVAVILCMGGAAYAADIGNLSGQSCGDATGTWHFVNNQTGGAAAGTLDAMWSSGNVCSVSASSVNKNNQHFYCIASGALLGASTDLPGRLVLSDFSCGTTPPPPPPPCDPKKDPDCK
ncbi:hypothetical protein [Marilutibacter alkalisoli]|uniref:Secreted protein n=1 Tax=Marilutibacter alkalisoli TaxID=2591633 RepID=A0A514BSD4_9GAMM|nr:hypothetical protein [Lysobacter alkalisoli]QDH70303.1 hypothetical protein FKV23_09535 [Lysobacter alkalisoli]